MAHREIGDLRVALPQKSLEFNLPRRGEVHGEGRNGRHAVGVVLDVELGVAESVRLCLELNLSHVAAAFRPHMVIRRPPESSSLRPWFRLLDMVFNVMSSVWALYYIA